MSRGKGLSMTNHGLPLGRLADFFVEIFVNISNVTSLWDLKLPFQFVLQIWILKKSWYVCLLKKESAIVAITGRCLDSGIQFWQRWEVLELILEKAEIKLKN